MENLVGDAKSDLIVPQAPFGDLAAANAPGGAWAPKRTARCTARQPGAGGAAGDPAGAARPLPSLRASIGRLVTRKVDRLSCVRFGPARDPAPVRLIGERVGLRTGDGRLLVTVTGTGRVVAEHVRVAPGEASVLDGITPARVRAAPGGAAENGRGEDVLRARPVAEAFITGAAAAGHTRRNPSGQPNTLRAAHGEEVFGAALGRAVAFGRRAPPTCAPPGRRRGTADRRAAGDALVLELRVVRRPPSAYAIGGLS